MAARSKIESVPDRLSALALRFSGMEGIGVSFEFFPPRTEEMERTLWRSLLRLAPLAPRFVSVTYGAGGSTRHRTHATVHRILEETPLVPAAHLTCVGAAREEVDEVARSYHAAGVRHIVALRGDPPEAGAGYAPHPGGYDHVRPISWRGFAGLRTSTSRSPPIPRPIPKPRVPSSISTTSSASWKRARTVPSPSSSSIPSYSSDSAIACAGASIEAPLIPGILPVTNYGQVARFARLCGTSVPAWLTRLFETLGDDSEARKLVAAMVAGEQCRILAAEGISDFHFYTLNRADLTFAICHMLGLRSAAPGGPPAPWTP